MLDRLVPVSRGVLDVDVCCASANPSTSFPPTTANMSAYVSNYAWHNNLVTLRSTQHHEPMWSDVHHSNYINSTMSNEPSYQWQNFDIPPSSGTLSPIIPPHLAAEYRFSSQPHGGNIHHFSEHSPANHPYFSPPHSHPPLLCCKWLHEDTLRVCGFQGTLEVLKTHCKTHVDVGPPHAQIECYWDQCNYKKRTNFTVRSMRRDCMWRHMCEVHLGMKRVI